MKGMSGKRKYEQVRPTFRRRCGEKEGERNRETDRRKQGGCQGKRQGEERPRMPRQRRLGGDGYAEEPKRLRLSSSGIEGERGQVWLPKEGEQELKMKTKTKGAMAMAMAMAMVPLVVSSAAGDLYILSGLGGKQSEKR